MGGRSVPSPRAREDRVNALLEQASTLGFLVVDLDRVGLIRTDDEGVDVRNHRDLGRGRGREVLLLDLTRNGVGVAEDEVHLAGRAAAVGSEHNRVRSLVGELLSLNTLQNELRRQRRYERKGRQSRGSRGGGEGKGGGKGGQKRETRKRERTVSLSLNNLM